MSVNKLEDVKIFETYFISFVKDSRFCRKAKILTTSNKNNLPEIAFEFCRTKTIHIAFSEEIGIGKTKKECIDNYGKIK